MLFIAGHHNVGKTTLAKKLTEFGFVHIETGNIIRQKHVELMPEIDYCQWVKEKSEDFNEYILQEVKNRLSQDKYKSNFAGLIVTGNRQLEGISFLSKNLYQIYNRKRIIIYLEAEDRLLYERQLQRSDRLMPKLSFADFRDQLLEFDRQMGVEEIKNNADYIIDGSYSEEIVLKKVINILNINGFETNSLKSKRELLKPKLRWSPKFRQQNHTEYVKIRKSERFQNEETIYLQRKSSHCLRSDKRA